MIRILHLHDPFAWGGLETWLMGLATSKAALGCQMDFLATTVDPAHQQTIRCAGARLFFGPRPKLVVPYLRRLGQVLREHGPYDIVHSHFLQHTGLALFEASRAGVPIRVAHSHGDLRPLIGNLGIASRTYLYLGVALTRLYATAGLADSQNAAAFLFGENWRSDPRWRVFLCGIDLKPFAASSDDATVRADLNISSRAFVIGHTGRFTFEKNHAFLLRVACEVVRRDSTALFLLAGDGPLRPEIQDRAKALGLGSHTRFLGARQDVPRLLKAMDAFVFPSLSEGLGLSLVEAQAAALPCVVSDTVPEEADVVQTLVTRLSLQDSPVHWAEKLLAGRNRPPLPKEAAWERVANSPFEMDISANSMKSFYLEQHQKASRRERGLMSPRIPSWFLREWRFWLFALVASFLPGRLTPIWEFLGVRATSTNWLLIVLGVSSLPPLLFCPSKFAAAHFPARWLITSFCAVLSYAAVSMAWSGTKWDVTMQMSFTLLATGSAALFAYGSVRNRPVEAIRSFLGRVAAFLCVVSGVYLSESLFALGLHGNSAVVSDDFGIARLSGPLFEPSTGYILLVPALAFQAEETLNRQKGILFGVLTSLILIMSILALGSRAGLLLLGLFAMGIVVGQRSVARCLAGASLMLFGIAIAWVLIFSRATPDRLKSTDDPSRSENHIAAFNTLKHRGILENIAGSGYGSVWPWYTIESEALGGNIYEAGPLTRDTREGTFLYHSHSTFLLLIVELGIPGLAFALLLTFSMGGMLVHAIRVRTFPVLAMGIAVSLLSLGFDLFLFHHPAREVVWWVLVFGTLALTRSETIRSNYRAKPVGLVPLPRIYTDILTRNRTGQTLR